ncbi:MAG: hypothetical protein SFU25_04260 [Candidatus Caenarcaniphilales bacterium]|nr:hypothetical protein [Candidatus Caenarcaniphilales bacterium]
MNSIVSAVVAKLPYTRKLQNALVRGPLDKVFTQRYKRLQLTRANEMPTLETLELRNVFNAIQEKGIFITSLDDLPKIFGIQSSSSQNLLNAMDGKIATLPSQDKNASTGMGRFISLDQLIEHQIITWPLNSKLYDLMENYFALKPAFVGPFFSRSYPNGEITGVRRTHVDTDDRRMLRAFIYLNDLDENSGPFRYLDKSQTQVIRDSMLSWWPKSFTDQDLAKLGIQKDDWKLVTGERGTVIFADTSQIAHSASLPTEGYRDMLTFLFASERPHLPVYLRGGLSINEKYLQRATSTIETELNGDPNLSRYVDSVNWARGLNPFVRALSGFDIHSN